MKKHMARHLEQGELHSIREYQTPIQVIQHPIHLGNGRKEFSEFLKNRFSLDTTLAASSSNSRSQGDLPDSEIDNEIGHMIDRVGNLAGGSLE
jgi:hypothetical protein